jgi:UDP-GlcNAc:undecaprenyl-phosphate/decaprenyl-phosphate GlcNAc-1-phosphate transferase
VNWGRLAVANHRGVSVPRILGLPLLLTALAGTVAASIAWNAGRSAWVVLGASALVFAAGLVDDLVERGPRGVRQHLRALGRLEISSGIVKVLVIFAGAVLVVATLPSRPLWAEVAAVVGIAACANLWNGLDVAPGRALKWFLLLGSPLAIAGFATASGWIAAPAVPSALLAGAFVLGPDLRERAMLGDAGANLLGFELGIGLCVLLSDAWIVVVAVAAVALNALAETLTLTRAIEAVPALRWFDRIGRVAERTARTGAENDG